MSFVVIVALTALFSEGARAESQLFQYQKAYASGEFEASFQAIQDCFASKQNCEGLSSERALGTALELSALYLKNPNEMNALLQEISKASDLHRVQRQRIQILLQAFSKMVNGASPWIPDLSSPISSKDSPRYFWYLASTPNPIKDSNPDETSIYRYIKAFYAVFPSLSKEELKSFLTLFPSSQRAITVRNWLKKDEDIEDGFYRPGS